MNIFTKKLKTKQFLFLWLPVLIWAGIIFSFSSMQTNRIGIPFNLLDFIIKKSAHLTEYAILAALFFRALYQTFSNQNYQKYVWTTFILVLLYAISDEYHQSFTFGRTATVRDVIIDAFGTITALILLKILKHRKNSNKLERIKRVIFG